MSGGGKINIIKTNNGAVSTLMIFIIIVIDLLLRALIFMYCYNVVAPKINLQLQKLSFSESLLVVIAVSCLIGK